MKPEADDEGYGVPLEHHDMQFMTGLLVAALNLRRGGALVGLRWPAQGA